VLSGIIYQNGILIQIILWKKEKAEWRDGFKSKLDDLAYKEALGKLPAHLLRNPAYEVTLNQSFLLVFSNDLVTFIGS
jgi:hypothetical protein